MAEAPQETDLSQIGTAGTADKVGQASRAAHIKIDKKRIRKYDRRRKEIIGMIQKALLWGLLFLALGVWLILLLRWWTITLGVLSLAIAWFWLYDIGQPIHALRSLYELYWDSTLLGSVVVRTDPLTVAGLVNLETGTDKRTVYRYFDGQGNEISQELYAEKTGQAQAEWDRTLDAEWDRLYEEGKEEEADALWEDFWSQPQHTFSREEDEEATARAEIRGCRLRVVGDGDWNYKLGDRIPCSSAYGPKDPELGIWTYVDIFPLIWATNNPHDLRACNEAVSEFEWEMLDDIAPLIQGPEFSTGEMYRIFREPEGAPTKYRLEPIDESEDEDEEEGQE